MLPDKHLAWRHAHATLPGDTHMQPIIPAPQNTHHRSTITRIWKSYCKVTQHASHGLEGKSISPCKAAEIVVLSNFLHSCLKHPIPMAQTCCAFCTACLKLDLVCTRPTSRIRAMKAQLAASAHTLSTRRVKLLLRYGSGLMQSCKTTRGQPHYCHRILVLSA